ncbi:MarR family winged helix-turn-helix transcriptional regulator [Pontibacter harenae]|uniref:MarR family winged helix-turn-helix transcriptional regulator n=1 Tax=Pontibacter harenae TaxID=2894083 RepID=UPI001E541078|nr:MarR family transcriptional regulator [Pontibacter harenae]MCC9168337.1 MarR family transcriptional regulator [Pontibacter harenae]
MMIENEMGIPAFRNEWQKASIGIVFTYGLLYNGYEKFFKKHGLTSQQYNILRILNDKHPEPVSTSYLREMMLDKMSDASRLVNRLSSKGLVDVSQNPSDKRLVNIVLSDKGVRTCQQVLQDIHNLDAYLKGISEDEAKQLTDLLFKVRESIRDVEETNAQKESQRNK